MRFLPLALTAVVVLTVAGCSSTDPDGGTTASTDGSAGATSAPPSPAPSTSSTSAATDTSGSIVTSATATDPSGTPTGTSGTNGTSSPAAPAVPVPASGAAGAYTLVSGGSTTLVQVDTVSCGQDGSLTGSGVALSAGARSMTITGTDQGTVTVSGSAELTAGGGTFRGASDTAAVSFRWTC